MNPGIAMPDDHCDDGNTDPFDACVNGRKAFCGDYVWHIGVEECEPGFNGWTKESCVNCKRVRYSRCEHHEECLGNPIYLPNGELRHDLCISGVCTPFGCDHGDLCSIPCPPVGSYDVRLQGTYCFIKCVGDQGCPKGLRCESESGSCVSQTYTIETWDP
jgi:hypothetical protein